MPLPNSPGGGNPPQRKNLPPNPNTSSGASQLPGVEELGLPDLGSNQGNSAPNNEQIQRSGLPQPSVLPQQPSQANDAQTNQDSASPRPRPQLPSQPDYLGQSSAPSRPNFSSTQNSEYNSDQDDVDLNDFDVDFLSSNNSPATNSNKNFESQGGSPVIQEENDPFNAIPIDEVSDDEEEDIIEAPRKPQRPRKIVAP